MTTSTAHRPVSLATTTVACHYGDAPLAGWLTRPAAGMPTAGVVVVPPFGYEAWSAHRTLRTLAEGLGAAGLAALRYDPAGTGNSGGDTWRPDVIDTWRASVRASVDLLRGQGCTWIALVGVRLGATIALLEGAAAGADAVVAWLPVENGRRYARELALLAVRPPEDDPRPEAEGATLHGGVPLMAAAVAEISSIKLASLPAAPAPRVLVVDAPLHPTPGSLAEALRGLGTDAEHRTIEDADAMIGVQTEKVVVPTRVVAELVCWLAEQAPDGPLVAPGQLTAAGRMAWAGGDVVEEEITLGSSGLRGMLGTPGSARRLAAQGLPAEVTVFLNPGSEHSVGPGRAWTEYARHLNVRGHSTLRLDFRGWGESPYAPDGGFGTTYDPHTEDDVVAAVADLRARGVRKIVLVGLCWSSWIALRAVLHTKVEGVYALNASFAWHVGIPPGQAEEESIRENAAFYTRVRLGAKYGVWTALDVLRLKNHNTRWLEGLGRTRIPIRLPFAEGDSGLWYVQQRLPRPMARLIAGGTVTLEEIPAIDHQMHREWLRPVIAADLTAFVERVG